MKINSALIIDDELDICLLLKNYLKKKTDKVSYSTNLKEGFSIFKEIGPDLLILDHNLPDGYGIDNIATEQTSSECIGANIVGSFSSRMVNL